MLRIRPYMGADHAACLAIFASNLPKFFAEYEREMFASYLLQDRKDESYFVAESEGSIRACGGFAVSEYGVAYLLWGMVEAQWHRRGLGSELLQWRLQRIREIPHAWCVLIDTSQHTAPFYERFGFSAFHQVNDGYQLGLDKIYMRQICIG